MGSGVSSKMGAKGRYGKITAAINVNNDAHKRYVEGLLFKNGRLVRITSKISISVNRLSMNHAVLNSFTVA